MLISICINKINLRVQAVVEFITVVHRRPKKYPKTRFYFFITALNVN